MALFVKRPRLTQEGATAVLNGAIKKAKQMNLDVCIAIVDDSALLLNFHRQDGARISSISIALTKAESAALRRSPTQPIGAEPDRLILSLGVALASKGAQTTLKGGLPLFVDGEIVGAIGVSGGTVDEDTEIAKSGIQAFEEALASSKL